jgi:hypothetical protein
MVVIGQGGAVDMPPNPKADEKSITQGPILVFPVK